MWPETAKGTPHRDMPKKPSSRASCTEHRTPRQCTRRAHEQLSSCRALRRAIRHEGLHVLGAASCEPSITRSCPLLYKIKGGAAAARPQGQPAIGAAAAGAMRAPICSRNSVNDRMICAEEVPHHDLLQLHLKSRAMGRLRDISAPSSHNLLIERIDLRLFLIKSFPGGGL